MRTQMQHAAAWQALNPQLHDQGLTLQAAECNGNIGVGHLPPADASHGEAQIDHINHPRSISWWIMQASSSLKCPSEE